MSLRTLQPAGATVVPFRGGGMGVPTDAELTLGDAGSPRALLDAAAAGSSPALRRLFAEHFEGVYAFLRMAMSDPDLTERSAVESLAAAIERRDECPPETERFAEWLRGIALEAIAATAKRAGGPLPDAPPQAERPDAERLRELLKGVSDTTLGNLVRALEPRSRQAVVLGLMAGLDDRAVAYIAQLDSDEVPALQDAGLAEIARLLERYKQGSEDIGRTAKELAYHVRAQPGPMSDGILVARGNKLMVDEAPASGWRYIARKALERLLARLRGHAVEDALDADVGDAPAPRPPGATPAQRTLQRPDPTPSTQGYDAPQRTPGLGGYRQPKGTPSTERLSSGRRSWRRRY